ncbi:MAG: cytidine deaminase [Mycoplasmataceae bacterium]|jgi:cytidine deaminase|nr:cytidine deaminase [Mycoplasmataceae bacterium]
MKNRYQELLQIIKKSYAPYSHFKVAAIVETDKGNFSGVNMENSSYSLSMCAERNAIGSAITAGAKQITAIHLLALSKTKNKSAIPCGACRQVMAEFAKNDFPIYVYQSNGAMKEYSFKKLLPFAFTLK